MRKILTIFFLLFIICIPIGWLTGIGSTFKLTEKRILAPLPAFTLARALDKKFYIELDRYFNDHFVFRGPLVKAKNRIDFSIFSSSPSKKVYVGKDDWLFSTRTLRDYLKDSCKNRQQLRELARGLQNIERELARHGQIFVFVIAPNKATIYPEYVGLARPKQDCGRSRYDLLLEAFDEFPVKGFIRLDKLLIEAKKDGQLYHKTGTHWNLRGERIAIKAILGYLESTGVTKGRSLESYLPEIETSKKIRMGDLGVTTSLKIDEDIETIKKITYRSETSVEELAPLTNDNNKRRHFKTVSRAHEGEFLLPSVVIYRDSFMTEPLRILKGSFESTHTLWTYNLLTEEGQNDLYNSRIVIQEIVERNLNHLF